MSLEPIDVTVVLYSPNESVRKAIEYAEKRGLVVEVLDDQMFAKGEFVFLTLPNYYYEDYTIHFMWMSLKFRGPECNAFRVKRCVVYDKSKKEFYCGDASKIKIFYRRESIDRSKYFTERVIFLFATIYMLPELNEQIPGDEYLVKVHNFFTSN